MALAFIDKPTLSEQRCHIWMYFLRNECNVRRPNKWVHKIMWHGWVFLKKKIISEETFELRWLVRGWLFVFEDQHKSTVDYCYCILSSSNSYCFVVFAYYSLLNMWVYSVTKCSVCTTGISCKKQTKQPGDQGCHFHWRWGGHNFLIKFSLKIVLLLFSQSCPDKRSNLN